MTEALPARLEFTALSSPLLEGEGRSLTATVHDAAGHVVAGAPVGWHSSAPAVVRVDSTSGAAVAVAPGSAVLSFTSGSASGQVSLTVLATVTGGRLEVAGVPLAGPQALGVYDTTAAIHALPLDGRGAVVAGRAVQWASSAPSVVGLLIAPDGSARLVGRAAGTATVTATLDTAHVTVEVVVRAPVVDHVVITRPASSTFLTGDTLVLSATAVDRVGRPVPALIDWYAYDHWGPDALVTIEVQPDSGRTVRLIGLRPGTDHIAADTRVTVDGVDQYPEDTLGIRVVAAPQLRVRATPRAVIVPAGGAPVQLSATVASPAGASLPGQAVTFTSTSPELVVTTTGAASATVTSTTPGAQGYVLARAVQGRTRGEDTVRVNTDSTLSMTVSLDDAVLTPNGAVRVQGSGLSGAVVRVAGVVAPITAASDTAVDFTVPACARA